ncbi:MAG: hypothetical protein PHH84_04365 [Oscillospiraceae bacterium]|nr:hypothetical protein [Oscillospiraceae bacterium]
MSVLKHLTPELVAIENNQPEKLQKLLNNKGINFPKIQFKLKSEMFAYIKSFDINIISGLSQHCPFHGGESFSIYKSATTTDYLCTCHSDKCLYRNKVMTIIELVAAVQKTDISRAITFLKRAFNCSYKIKEPKKEIGNNSVALMMEANLKTLNGLQISCPTAVKVLGKSINVLIALYNLAIEGLGDYSTSKEHCVISVSMKYLQSCMNKNGSITGDMAVLAYLGFLKKIPLHELITERYFKMISFRESNSMDKTVSQLCLYELTPAKLREIEENAKRWKLNGYNPKNITFAVIREIEGPFVACRIFPQQTIDDSSSQRFAELQKDIYSIVLLSIEDISFKECMRKLLNLKDGSLKPKYTSTYITNFF